MKLTKYFSNMADVIIEKRKLIEKIFAVLFLINLICFPMVGINYDMGEYLPHSAPSKAGLDVMEKEFGYPGTARIMIGDGLSLYDAKEYKEKISKVEGVDSVSWADSATTIFQSSQFLTADDVKDYYKDGYAVMDVTFVEGDSSNKTRDAISKIQEITGDKGYFSGPAVQNKSLNETLAREISIAMVMAVIMIFAILILTTTSWFEPIMFMVVMAVAIVLNMGSNLMFGSVSFLTFSMAPILQLAIAVDYSVFLLHAYTKERQKGLDVKQALANGIRTSSVSIISGGATAFVGFIVMGLMRFSIGKDIGFVLAKGIVVSIITVLLLMPAFIIRWSHLVEKTAHKPFVPSFRPLGKAVFKVRYAVLILVALVAVPTYVAKGMNNFSYGNSATGSSPGTKVYEDEQKINKLFGRSNMMLVVYPNTDNVTEHDLADKLDKLEYVKSVTALSSTLPDGVPESIVPDSIKSKLHTEKYARMLVYIKTSDESEVAFRCSDEIQKIVKQSYPTDSYLVGLTPSTQDIKEILTADFEFVDKISILGVALVILLTFRCVTLPVIIVIPIEVAIFINMALPYVTGNKMVYMGYIIVTCLQLGATVDYSILLSDHYLENRKTMGKRESAIEAVTNSTLSIATSGLILTIVGYGLSFISTVSAIADMGELVGRGAFLSMVLVLFVLPVLLEMTDGSIMNQRKRTQKWASAIKTGLRSAGGAFVRKFQS